MRDLAVCNSGDRSSGPSTEFRLLIPSRGCCRRCEVGDVGVDREKLTLLLSGSWSSPSTWRSAMLLSAVSSRGSLVVDTHAYT